MHHVRTSVLCVFFQSIGGVYTGLMQAVGASEKVFEYINRKPALPNEGKHAPEKLDGRLEFKNVCFSYPTRPDSTVLNVSNIAHTHVRQLCTFENVR